MCASDTTAAAAYAGDIEGWLKLTGYAGDAAALARALRCRAVDTLTDGGETLAAAQVLTAVKPPDLARLGRLREVQGRLHEAAETFEAAEMPADALRNWRAAGKWQQAVRLAEGQERSDLAWLVELDTLVRRRRAGQRRRLTGGERECLVQLLDTVERLPTSGRTAAVASALPLVILPALGPGLRPGSSKPTVCQVKRPRLPPCSGHGGPLGEPPSGAAATGLELARDRPTPPAAAVDPDIPRVGSSLPPGGASASLHPRAGPGHRSGCPFAVGISAIMGGRCSTAPPRHRRRRDSRRAQVVPR